MKEFLYRLTEHKRLSAAEAREALLMLARGEVNKSQAAAFLTIYLMRNISVEELSGFRDAMLELCIPVDLKHFDPIDVCGTGGDGKNTFNISTAAAFVAAGAGVKVAKHGNNGVSSKCGSSNVMAHLGYHFTNDLERLEREIEQTNLCFLHAPLFHPAMKEVAPIRQELGMKTFFNMLGPIVNPSRPSKQLVGVFDLELARRYQYLLQPEAERFTIVHTLTGYDEVSLTAPFKMITKDGETIKTPDELGFKTLNPSVIKGGETVEESAEMMIKILKGEGDQARESVVVANAALAISTARGNNYFEAKEEAVEAIRSGRAIATLKNLIAISDKSKANYV